MKRLVLMIISALICGVFFTSCDSDKAEYQERKTVGEMSEVSEWWQPILEKHNLKLGAYNNFDNVFEMGMEGNSINNGICTLKVATVLIMNSNNSYILIEADSIYHNVNEGIFDIMSGTAKIYEMDADLSDPSVLHLNATRIRLTCGSESVNY